MEVCWITEAGAKRLSEDSVREVLSSDEGLVWIHLDHTEQPALALLAEVIRVHPADVEDCHLRTPVPKLRGYADHYYSAINGLARGIDGRLHFQPLKMFIGTRLLFTVFGPHHEALTREALRRDVDAVWQRLEMNDFCPRSGVELGATIRTEMLRSQEHLVESAAGRIAKVELNLMKLKPIKAEGLLGDLFGLRHDLQTIHTNAAQTHEMYVHTVEQQSLQQEGVMRLDPRRLNDLRQGYAHLKNTTDLEREYLQEVLDMFQTRVSTELNRFVRKLTAFGTIGIAWTVITGIYGMNFEHMPELAWGLGYPVTIGLMAVVGLVLAAIFRRQGWL
jgi:magnesium transporter